MTVFSNSGRAKIGEMLRFLFGVGFLVTTSLDLANPWPPSAS